MRVITALFAALLVVASAQPLSLTAHAQGKTRAEALRMQEYELKQLLAKPLSDASRRMLEARLLRVQAEMIQPDAPKGVVVVRDTCNLPDGSMHRAGDSASYGGQRYRCADVYDQTLTRTGVGWIKVFQE